MTQLSNSYSTCYPGAEVLLADVVLPPELLALCVGDERGAGGGQGLGPRHQGGAAGPHLCAGGGEADRPQLGHVHCGLEGENCQVVVIGGFVEVRVDCYCGDLQCLSILPRGQLQLDLIQTCNKVWFSTKILKT